MSISEGQSATVTVGEALAEVLARAGVKIAFTVPGESLLGLLDGLAANRVRIVTTRHEGAASFMAEAVAQLTGRPVLVLAGRAPGAANLSIGLHAARSDSAPVIAIVGQVRREFLGREAFQEMDLVKVFEPIVKWAAEAREPGEVAALGEKAVATATKGRPGPVLLSIPEDLLDLAVPSGHPTSGNRIEHQDQPDEDLVRKTMHLLLDARRPLIVAGAGVLRARSTDALVRFAETVQVPVVASWRRGDVFPNDHALYLGMTGLGSPASVRARLEEADALLVLGCRMGEMTTYGYTIPSSGTRWAQVDVEPGAAAATRPEIVVAADVAAFLRVAHRALANAALDSVSFDARRLENSADREAFEAGSKVGEEPWDGPGVHPGRVVATLARVLPPEAIITTDAGDFGTWAARGYRFHRPGTFLGSTSGAMGFGLPAAIGATLARPGRLGVALAGDGGFAMTMAELETAVRERAHVIAIVFDNGRYGTIWRHQMLRGGPGGLATRLGAMDFAAIARACGALGLSVNSDDEFEPALRQAIEAGRPAVLHLALDPRWTVPDASPSSDEVASTAETDMESEGGPALEDPAETQSAPSIETASEAPAEAATEEPPADEPHVEQASAEDPAEVPAATDAEPEPEPEAEPEPEPPSPLEEAAAPVPAGDPPELPAGE
jgi:acetolactate synthase-1/2/3 large subunit